MVSTPEMVKKKFYLSQKAQNGKYSWIAEMTEIYEMNENVETAEGLKWPKQHLLLIGFEVP